MNTPKQNAQQSNQKMYQTKEVSHMLKVTGTSVRRYCKDFTNHLSDGTRRKRRIFTDDDVAVFKRAQQLMGEGYTKPEVDKILYTEKIAPEEPTETALAIFPELTQMIKNLRDQLLAAAERQEQQQQTIDELTARIEQLEKPWYQRIFRRE